MTTKTMRLTTGTALMALVVALLPSDSSAQRKKDRFGDTTSVTVVEIPVQVIRDGAPVRGLTAENFEILDGRKRQELVALDIVDLTLESGTTEQGQVAQMPVAARRCPWGGRWWRKVAAPRRWPS